MKLYGFHIIYFDGKYQDITMKKIDLPPKIMHHRPDVVGEKDGFFCIGEAKTEGDIDNERTKNQVLDFMYIVALDNRNKLIIGIPEKANKKLDRLLTSLGLYNHGQIEIICIPEGILPDEEDL